MKKTIWPYFKPSIMILTGLQVAVLIFSVIGYFYFRDGTPDDLVIPICGLIQILCIFVAMISCSSTVTYAIVTENKIESFSLLNRKLCVVNLDEPFYYARIHVPNSAAPKRYIDAIYVSNSPIVCKFTLLGQELVKKLNKKNTAMFPYDKTVSFIITSPLANRVSRKY